MSQKTLFHSPRLWWLLVHQLPQKPDYFRMKILRRLQRLGAVALKNSVYALPPGESTHEDLQWLLREIREGGGEGSLCEARFTDGLADAEIERLFQRARDADYQALLEEADLLAQALKPDRPLDPDLKRQAERDLGKLRSRFDEVSAIDFFHAPAQRATESFLLDLQSRLEGKPRKGSNASAFESPRTYRGRVWVTRQGVKVDRIASAWLIRRFVDPKAKLKFVEGKSYRPKPNEVRFDMFDAEFTHERNDCTFETLIRRLRLVDRGLAPIAEIVHDIDIKDAKFGRDEAKGVGLMIETLTTLNASDEDRIEKGSALFNDLYEHYRRKPE